MGLCLSFLSDHTFFQDLVESNIFFMALFPNSFECNFKNNVFDGYKDHFTEVVPNMESIDKSIRLYRFDENPLILQTDIRSQNLSLLQKNR